MLGLTFLKVYIIGFAIVKKYEGFYNDYDLCCLCFPTT